MPSSARRFFAPSRAKPEGWRAYAAAAAAVAAVTALGALMLGHLAPVNIVMLFPLAVLFAAIRLGRGPAVLAAFLSVALFDFFFVNPHFTFAVSDLEYVVTFAVLLIVALITAELASNLRLQCDAAELRERTTRALYEMGGELSGALTNEQIGEIADRHLQSGFGVRATLWLPGPDGELMPIGQPRRDIATRARDGFVVPLRTPMRARGEMVIESAGESEIFSLEQRQFLDMVAALIAVALERVRYLAVAHETQLAVASERLRNSLLGALSHDLRTPMTALVGLADTLSLVKPPLPPQQAELTAAIRDEALRTSALVHNLLDMARLQSGGVRLRREWQPLEEVVGAALQARMRQLASHRLHLGLPPDLPLVHVDAVLMERVFCNLLENAAKYTPPGSLIEIDGQPCDQWIEVTVADNGPGLPPGREREVFAKFSRAPKESTVPGVGLGLAIVEAIVEAHGGRVRAENRRGGGSRFVIELPRGEPPALPEAEL